MMTHQSKKYIVNSHYKCSIPNNFPQNNHQLNDQYWIKLFQQFFSKKSISIYFDTYDKNNFTTVLENLLVTDIQELQIQYTGQSRILKYLAFPYFKDLTKLNLSNNFITSIQFLGTLPAPNLQVICLNENKIQNIKPIHKNRFQKLNSIDLRNNSIMELKSLQSLKVNQLILQNLDYDKVMSYNLYPILKLGTNQLKKLKIQGFERFSLGKLEKIFKNRFKGIWIYKKKQQFY